MDIRKNSFMERELKRVLKHWNRVMESPTLNGISLSTWHKEIWFIVGDFVDQVNGWIL